MLSIHFEANHALARSHRGISWQRSPYKALMEIGFVLSNRLFEPETLRSQRAKPYPSNNQIEDGQYGNWLRFVNRLSAQPVEAPSDQLRHYKGLTEKWLRFFECGFKLLSGPAVARRSRFRHCGLEERFRGSDPKLHLGARTRLRDGPYQKTPKTRVQLRRGGLWAELGREGLPGIPLAIRITR
jgi:hypothetical protein